MRIEPSPDQKQVVRLAIAIFAAVGLGCVIFSGIDYLRHGGTFELGFMLFGIVLLLSLPLFGQVWTVDETGVKEYLYFGRIKLRELTWEEAAFVGSAVMKIDSFKNVTGRMIVCSITRPKKRYHNSLSYQQPKGKHINLPDRPDVRALVQQYVGDRFEEL